MPTINGVWRPHHWSDWEVDLVDASWDTVDAVQEAVLPSIDWAIYGHGMGSLSVHIESRLAVDLLTEGQWYFKFYRDGVHLRDFMLSSDDRGYQRQAYRDDEYIKVALAPLDALFKGKQCLPDAGTAKLETPSLPVDDAFKWIVDHVCGPNAYDDPDSGSRAISGLAITTDASAHATTKVLDEFDKLDLFEALQKYGPTYGVDWRVRLIKGSGTANTPTFETFVPTRGLDKTEDNGVRMPVIINDASGELLSAKRHTARVGFANVVYSKNLASQVIDSASVALYGRHEVIADTNDTDKMNGILQDRVQRAGDGIEFAESEMIEIGTESWQIQPGDTLRTGNNHLGLAHQDATLKQVTFTIEKTGEERTKLVLGEYEKTLADKINEAGGGGRSGRFDPLLGLTVGATTVHFSDDDPSTITLVAGTGVTLTPNDGAGTITVAATPAVSLLGNGTAQYQVPMTGADPFTPAWTALSADVSAGGIAPLRSDANGELTLHALQLPASAYIDKVSAAILRVNTPNTLDLAIGATTMVRMQSNVLFPLSSGSGAVSLGTTTWRWSTVAGVEGNFSGDVTIAAATKGLVMSSNTSGKLLVGNGTKYVPKTPSLTGHTAGWTTTGSPDYGANPLRTIAGTVLYLQPDGTLATGSGTSVGIGATEHYHNLTGSSSNMGRTTGNSGITFA